MGLIKYDTIRKPLSSEKRAEMVERFCRKKNDLASSVDSSIGDEVVEALKSFGIDVSFDSIECGPVITRVNVRPARGVKASSIMSAETDLAIALRAENLNCVVNSAIGCVSIEIPAQPRRIVAIDRAHLKSIVEEAIATMGNDCDLNFIDTSNVTDMSWIFNESQFNGDISQWNVNNVTNMAGMFYNSKFQGDISSWNFNKCIDKESLFQDAFELL